jgi:hypothetical protein
VKLGRRGRRRGRALAAAWRHARAWPRHRLVRPPVPHSFSMIDAGAVWCGVEPMGHLQSSTVYKESKRAHGRQANTHTAWRAESCTPSKRRFSFLRLSSWPLPPPVAVIAPCCSPLIWCRSSRGPRAPTHERERGSGDGTSRPGDPDCSGSNAIGPRGANKAFDDVECSQKKNKEKL